MAVVFPRPYAYPFAFTGTFPAKGPGAAQARLAYLEKLAEALYAWVVAKPDRMLEYKHGYGDAALDALLDKHKRRSAYVDVAPDGASWITDGNIMLRTSVDFGGLGRRNFKLLQSLTVNFTGTEERAVLPLAPLIYSAEPRDRGQPHVYLNTGGERQHHHAARLEDLACLAALGELWRGGSVIGAKDAEGNWRGFCIVHNFDPRRAVDVNGAPWSPACVDQRTPPEPKVKGPTWAPRPPLVPTLQAALKRKGWQQSIAAYKAAFARVEALCSANNGHCSHDPEGVYPSGVAFLSKMKAANGFTIIDGGMQAQHFLLWGGLLADRRGLTAESAAASIGYENAKRHLAQMTRVCDYAWTGDGRMDRASDGTPRLWIESVLAGGGNVDPARTPVPALDFIGALYVLTGGVPEYADVYIYVNQVRTEESGGVSYRHTSHLVELFGALADGTPWALIMVELCTPGDELPRWEEPLQKGKNNAAK